MLNRLASENQLPGKLPAARSSLAYRFTRPLVELLAKTGISPSGITWAGFILAAGAAALIISRHFIAAGFVVLVGGFFDMLDGALARRTNRVTRFGAILDSALDRFSEALLLIGILVFYAQVQDFAGVVLVGIALFTSQMVSYLRARAEALGLEGKEGIFTRPERVIVLMLGLLLAQFRYALFIAIAIIAVFSFVTLVQRLVSAWRQTRE